MSQIEKDIQKGTFSRVYLLYGDEDFLKRHNRDLLRNALIAPGQEMNLAVWKSDGFDFGQFVEQAQTMPFFADHRLLIVEDSGLFKRGGDEMADFLPSLPDTAVALFVEKETDKRSRLFNYVRKAGVVLELGRRKEETLSSWIILRLDHSGKKIQRQAMKLLLERTGPDMDTIRHEVDKLISYTGDSDAVMLEDVRRVVTDHSETVIFRLADLISRHDRDHALALYHALLFERNTPLSVLGMLSRHFERLLRIKDLRAQGYDRAKITEKLDMKPFLIQKGIGQAEAFSVTQLKKALAKAVEAEQSVKSGRMEDVLAVELVILETAGR